jgi:hypothetical protein
MRALSLCAAAALQAGVAVALAGCQDAAASNPERETHMGDVRAAEPPPPLPPAPANASPTPLSVAMPALTPTPVAPPAPPTLMVTDAGAQPLVAPNKAAPGSPVVPAKPLRPAPPKP